MGIRQILRALLIGAMLCSWLAISNHCALAAFSIAPSATVSCPMHSPAQQKGDTGLICCKILRAASAPAIVKAVAPASQLLNAFTADLATAVSPRDLLAQPRLVTLDTGPLGIGNFAELVLQRSLRAHAPPSLS